MAEERGFGRRTGGAGAGSDDIDDVIDDFEDDDDEFDDDNPVVRFLKKVAKTVVDIWNANTLNKILLCGSGVLAFILIFVMIVLLSSSDGEVVTDDVEPGKELIAVKPDDIDSLVVTKPKPDVVIPDKDDVVQEEPKIEEPVRDANGNIVFVMYSESDPMDVVDEIINVDVRPTSEILAEEAEAARIAAEAANVTTTSSSSGGSSRSTGYYYGPSQYSVATYDSGFVNYMGSTYVASGQVGQLQIESIGLNTRVNSTPDLLDYGSNWRIPGLDNGVGHYPNTPWFDGTVGIAGHNHTHFKNLGNAQIGDKIVYTVNGVTRTYEIVNSEYVSDDSWGVFVADGTNKLVLTTCESNEFHGRLAVTAVQVGGDVVGGVEQALYTGQQSADNTISVPSGGQGYVQGASRPAPDDTRGQNGHHNDIVEGNTPKIQDEYQDAGHNDWLDVFTGFY